MPTRRELKRGFQPWNSFDSTSLWVYNSLLTSTGELSVEEAKHEWCTCMRYWVSETLHNKRTKLVNPVNTICDQQVGLYLKQNCHCIQLLRVLDIFLQPITEAYYTFLENSHYHQLHKSWNESGQYNGYYIMFGPGTLARKSIQPNKDCVFTTGCINTSLVHFQLGCGQVYDPDKEDYVYYNGSNISVTHENDLPLGTCTIDEEVQRTSMEIEKIYNIKKLDLDIQDAQRIFFRHE